MKEHNELVRIPADRQDLAVPTAPPPTIDYEVETEDNEIHLLNYWNTIRKHVLLIISITLLTTIMMAIYVARQTAIYDPKTRIQLVSTNNPAYAPAPPTSCSITLRHINH